MKRRLCCLSITFALGLGLVLALLWLGCAPARPVLAQAGTGVICVSNSHPNSLDTPGCGSEALPCLTVQYAVDQALPGEEIRVAAGIYTQVNSYGGQRQVVAISKTLSLRGGYTTTTLAGRFEGSGWLPPDAGANPTILDAQKKGRVLHISGDIAVTIEGLHLTGGDNTPEDMPWPSSPGGGVYVLSATTTFSACDVYDNIANTSVGGFGGGIHAESATLTVYGCDVHQNVAGDCVTSHCAGKGGGLSLLYGSATLTGNRIHHNYGSHAGAGFGGGLYASNTITLSLTNNEILSNTAVGDLARLSSGGGGAYLEASPATLAGNTIAGNYACRTHCYNASGGGLSWYQAPITLTGNLIVSNTAAGQNCGRGGGLDGGFSRARLVDNTIQDNTAGQQRYLGQPIDCWGGGVALSGCDSCSLNGNRFESNTASTAGQGQGGGLWFRGGEADLLRNNLLHNSATMSTTAQGQGGALFATGKVTITMINNMVIANQANSQGSGLWFGGNGSQAQGWLLHNTIADNGAQGVYAAPTSTLALSNTILSGHTGAAIFVSDTSTVTLEASLWFSNGADTAGPGTITTGTINVSGNPAYANPAGGDYHLTLGSAALDAGIDAGVDDDFDNQPRPARAGYDMGADELPAAAHSAYLPCILKDH